MASPILKFKRGNFSNLPGLQVGEPALTVDKFDLYVGIDSTTSNNKFIGSQRFWTVETATSGSGVNLVEGSNNGANHLTLKAPAAITSNQTYTFPAAAVNKGLLMSDGSGNLTWDTGGGFADGSLVIDALDIDGGTDIGADLVDADEVIVDDGGGGTNRKSDLSRVKKYIYSAASGDATASDSGAITLAASGVSAATVGSSTAIPILTIDAKGRVTNTSSTAIDQTSIAQGNSSISVTDAGTGSATVTIDGATHSAFAAAGITLSQGAFVGNLTGDITGSVAGATAGTLPLVAVDIDGGTDIGAALADADLFVVDDGAGGTNRKTAASRIKTYIADVTLTTAAQTNITSLGTIGSLVASSAKVSDLTSGRVVLAGTSGEIEDSGNLTFDGSTLAVTGAANVSTNLTVGGNLTINGTTTQINTVNTTIEDTLLELQVVDGSALGSDTNKDVGLIMNYYSGSAKKAAFYWDDSTGRFVLSAIVTESSGALTNSTSGGMEVGSLYVNDCAGISQVISCSGTTRSLENINLDGGTF